MESTGLHGPADQTWPDDPLGFFPRPAPQEAQALGRRPLEGPRPGPGHICSHGGADHHRPVGPALRRPVHVRVALSHPSAAAHGQTGRRRGRRPGTGPELVGPELRGAQEEGGAGGASGKEPPPLAAGEESRPLAFWVNNMWREGYICKKRSQSTF